MLLNKTQQPSNHLTDDTGELGMQSERAKKPGGQTDTEQRPNQTSVKSPAAIATLSLILKPLAGWSCCGALGAGMLRGAGTWDCGGPSGAVVRGEQKESIQTSWTCLFTQNLSYLCAECCVCGVGLQDCGTLVNGAAASQIAQQQPLDPTTSNSIDIVRKSP
jgi:hypothetical protein